MLKFLRCLDYYGEEVRIAFNNEDSVSTAFGGILTILTVIFLIAGTWIIGKDIIYKQNPNTYQQTNILEESPHITLNSSSFPFGFSLWNITHPLPIDESLIKFKAIEKSFLNNDTNAVPIVKEIKIEKCNLNNYQVSETEFANIGMDNFYCLNDNYTLEGSWSDKSISYLWFYAYICGGVDKKYPYNNDNNNDQNLSDLSDDCKNKNEINNYFKNEMALQINFYFVDHTVSVGNYSNPINSYINNRYFFLKQNVTKLIEFELQELKLTTDDGFLFENNNNNIIKHNAVLKTNDEYSVNGLLFESLFYSSRQQKFVIRSYIKLPEIIADIGGLLEVICMVCMYLNLPFARASRYLKIMKNVFHLEKDGYKDNKENEINKNYSELQKIESNSQLDVSTTRKKEYKFTVDDITRAIKQNNIQTDNKMTLSCGEKISLFLNRKSNPKIKWVKKISEVIDKHFDLIYIIRKMYEIEHIKKVLFNSDQNFIFSHIIPQVEEDNTYISDKEFGEKNIENKVENIMNGITNQNEVDNKIVKLLLNIKE